MTRKDYEDLLTKSTAYVDTAPAVTRKIGELRVLTQFIQDKVDYIEDGWDANVHLRVSMEKLVFSKMKDHKWLWDGSGAPEEEQVEGEAAEGAAGEHPESDNPFL